MIYKILDWLPKGWGNTVLGAIITAIAVMFAISEAHAQTYNVYGPIKPNQIGVASSNYIKGSTSFVFDGSFFTQGTTTDGVESARFLVNGLTGNTANANAETEWNDLTNFHMGFSPDTLATTAANDFMEVLRNAAAVSGACGHAGVVTPAYVPCQVFIGTDGGTSSPTNSGTQFIIGPLNGPTGGASPNDVGFRARCFYNDSCGWLAGEHSTGTQAYSWDYLYAGASPVTRYGTMMERVPASASSASTAQRQPHLTGAPQSSATLFISGATATVTAGSISVGQTIVNASASPAAYLVLSGSGPFTLSQSCTSGCGTLGSPIVVSVFNEVTAPYEGWMTSPGNFIWQLSDGGPNSDLGGPLEGVSWLTVTKTAGVQNALVTLGDSLNSASITSVIGYNMVMQSGNANNTTDGGLVSLTASAGANSIPASIGGPVTITAGMGGGNGAGASTGGAVTIAGGGGSTTNTTGGSTGGAISLSGGVGGTSTGTSNGGSATLRGGAAGGTTTTSASGGQVSIIAGSGGAAAATAIGAPIVITAGSAGASSNSAGGNITLKPGAAAGSGNTGIVRLQDSTAGTWAQVSTAVGFQNPTKTANGGITCAAGTTGSMMSVSDALVPVNGNAYSSGGAVPALIWCNGTSWIVTVH